jgi:hypothetical protein
MSRLVIRVSIFLLVFGVVSSPVAADWVHIVGAGVDSSLSGTVNGHRFEQYDLDFRLSTPWSWALPWSLSLDTQIAVIGSYLQSQGDSGFAAFAGPNFILSRKLSSGLSIFTEVGTGPTLLTNHDFGQTNLGGTFQFTHHFSAGFQGGHWVLAARFQHMSNAHIYKNNPGVDLRMLQLDYRF